MKRKTVTHRRHTHPTVLQVRVMSPRIAWFGFLKLSGKFVKLIFLLAILAGIGWGAWCGIEHAFLKNPDFRLQVIDLNANPVIDEIGISKVANIDLAATPSLFDVDVTKVTGELKKIPAIAEARVERHLPSTLVVRVVTRNPKAWIANSQANLSEVRHAGGMLVDDQGVVYPCPEMQFESARVLPIIKLPLTNDHPIELGARIQQPALDHCFELLDSACEADAEASQWIESISPVNDWSLLLITRQGTAATFGLSDHARQIESLRAALDHAGEKGYVIDTINLIPKYNIPITVRNGNAAPKAIPVTAAIPENPDKNRRSRDLSNLLNRN